VINTAEEAVKYFSKLPPDTKVRIYNRDCWEHTPVRASFYDDKSGISITNTVIVESAIVVTTEDYD
jgi:hypothetical protein